MSSLRTNIIEGQIKQRVCAEQFIAEHEAFIRSCAGKLAPRGWRWEQEDMEQEAYLAILQALAAYDPTLPAEPWIYVVIKNHFASLARRASKDLLFHADPVPPDADCLREGKPL